jgi:WD40 repeat protein
VSSDGQRIVTASHDTTLRIWETATARMCTTLGGLDRDGDLTGHLLSVSGCAWSPDGSWIVSAGGDGVKMWEAATGAERAILAYDSVWACAVSPDGTWLASGSDDGTLRIWDTRTGTQRALLTGHTGAVLGCAVSPDGTWLASASQDRTFRVWHPTKEIERATFPLTASGHCVAWHPTQPLVVGGDGEGNVYLLDCMGVSYDWSA